MDHQPRDNADPQIETDELSPGEARIAKVKAAPRSVFHFGLFTIVWLTIAAAIFMAVPRLWEIEYDAYFMLWYLVLYGCAPLAGWTTYAALPPAAGPWRLPIATLVFAAIVLPLWLMAAWDSGSVLYAVKFFFGTALFFWLPQIICIAAVRYIVFGTGSRR